MTGFRETASLSESTLPDYPHTILQPSPVASRRFPPPVQDFHPSRDAAQCVHLHPSVFSPPPKAKNLVLPTHGERLAQRHASRYASSPRTLVCTTHHPRVG
ncbi:hypothetical protein HYPSUDRAFT_38150 [Hypholoma sublateritium FD-334 SS-4]|uniref:Uncharacterized protein n=1 Tax=Hypholoma sublateritium (strain FD-334 SS-4) TaxID=945553 RepID=A0A0D2LD07_HYPSF|nr:hypothetical protein HYPSUDRAFT_38150 [Hypholoma sublateritium FD-334 SS-4]